jgi:hypothetical protein
MASIGSRVLCGVLAPVLAICVACPARAELMVVAGVDSGLAALSRADVVNIFMGRLRVLPDGRDAHPLDAPADSVERATFYRRLLGKGQQEIRAYWARLVFSGRTAPPRERPPGRSLQAELDADPQAIAYVERRDLTRRMIVLYSLAP